MSQVWCTIGSFSLQRLLDFWQSIVSIWEWLKTLQNCWQHLVAMDLQIWPPPPPGSAGSSHLGLHQHPFPKEDIGVEARHAEHLISRLTAHQQTLPDLLVLHHPRHIHHAIFDGPPMYGHSPGGKARNHGDRDTFREEWGDVHHFSAVGLGHPKNQKGDNWHYRWIPRLNKD